MAVFEMCCRKSAIGVNGDAVGIDDIRCTCGVERGGSSWRWTDLSTVGVVCGGQLCMDSGCVCGEWWEVWILWGGCGGA